MNGKKGGNFIKNLLIINDISYLIKYLRSKKLDKEDELEVMEKIIILNDFRIKITENMIDDLSLFSSRYELDRKAKKYIDKKLEEVY